MTAAHGVDRRAIDRLVHTYHRCNEGRQFRVTLGLAQGNYAAFVEILARQGISIGEFDELERYLTVLEQVTAAIKRRALERLPGSIVALSVVEFIDAVICDQVGYVRCVCACGHRSERIVLPDWIKVIPNIDPQVDVSTGNLALRAEFKADRPGIMTTSYFKLAVLGLMQLALDCSPGFVQSVITTETSSYEFLQLLLGHYYYETLIGLPPEIQDYITI